MPIHPSAVIHPSVELPLDAEVGPYVVLDEDVVVGAGARIGPFCHLYSGVRLEENVTLSDGVILGNRPQDLKYQGEKTFVGIGRGSVLREYVTVNRGTRVSGWTRVGRDCLIMAYTHVAHDCVLCDGVVLANAIHMGGHVYIGEGAVVSGMTGIHQFVTIGPGAFIGGGLRVDKDVLPFSKALGEPLRWAGLNPLGLVRLGFTTGDQAVLKACYRTLFAEGKEAALAGLSRDRMGSGEAAGTGKLANRLGDFFDRQSRGILVRPLRD